jgi:hypothetical protein
MKRGDLIAFGGISPTRVALFEERIGCVLPSDYRQFLIDYNGGEPSGVFLGVVSIGSHVDREVDVNLFLGLDLPQRIHTLDFAIDCDQGRSGLEYSKYISIARGSAQIVYRLCLLPDRFGVIFYDDQNFEGEVYPMGESWSEFFDRLYLDESEGI